MNCTIWSRGLKQTEGHRLPWLSSSSLYSLQGPCSRASGPSTSSDPFKQHKRSDETAHQVPQCSESEVRFATMYLSIVVLFSFSYFCYFLRTTVAIVTPVHADQKENWMPFAGESCCVPALYSDRGMLSSLSHPGWHLSTCWQVEIALRRFHFTC